MSVSFPEQCPEARGDGHVHRRLAVTAARSLGPTLAWVILKPCIMAKAMVAPMNN